MDLRVLQTGASSPFVEVACVIDHAWQASLMGGWILTAVQLLAAAALLYAIGWRRRRWRTMWVPLSVVVGALTATLAYWYFSTLGIASEPAPWQMWLWVALVGVATAVAITGWRSAGWWRRNVSVFAASFCMLSMGLTINAWLGYFPTVDTAWSQLTNRPLPNQVDPQTVQSLKHRAIAPRRGVVVPVDTGDRGSGFKHRQEWVYLPPAWFASTPAPRLPAVLMIGGEFNTPADWARAGDAVTALDAFAAAHAGVAPVAVFADATGGFTVDTECVNGPRGNAADHLTADVIPEVSRQFGLGDQASWGIVGFSSGGTCAVDFAVMHPGTISAFVDIGGDIGPNAGTRAQTIDRLYGGDAAAWSWFDPSTAIARHGPYNNLSGMFAVPGAAVGQAAAESLCALGTANGISCQVVALPGKHDWPSAAHAFAATLPWLADRLGTPPLTSAVAQ
ncbi:alpha/beta hydrolase [Mycobacterium kubicae]|uniref:alpha/beta hydrolase n=1 Tax=Mycobacterium kubicae TaxID=120959 RepID=UPI00353085FB